MREPTHIFPPTPPVLSYPVLPSRTDTSLPIHGLLFCALARYRLTLLYSTCLFLSREGFRKSCINYGRERWPIVANVVWLPYVLATRGDPKIQATVLDDGNNQEVVFLKYRRS